MCKEWIDEVLIVTSGILPYPTELIDVYGEPATIHMNLAKVTNVPRSSSWKKVGAYTVLTTSMNYASSFQLMLKKTDRHCGRSGGLYFLSPALFFLVAPAIYIASGPIFCPGVWERWKAFKMYKFEVCTWTLKSGKQN